MTWKKHRGFLVSLVAGLALLALSSIPARANVLTSANATLACSPSTLGSLTVTGTTLTPADNYSVTFTFVLIPDGGGSNVTITGSVPVGKPDASGNLTAMVSLPGAPPGDWDLMSGSGMPGDSFVDLENTTTSTSAFCDFPLPGQTTECDVTINGVAPSSPTTLHTVELNCPVANACPLTQGFWKNHPQDWPVTSLMLGTVTYTESQLLTILKTPVKGDASIDLAHQLIAAKLNLANGSNPSPISAVITDADGDIDGGTIPEGVKTSSTLGQDMTGDASELDGFNSSRPNGCTGPS